MADRVYNSRPLRVQNILNTPTTNPLPLHDSITLHEKLLTKIKIKTEILGAFLKNDLSLISSSYRCTSNKF